MGGMNRGFTFLPSYYEALRPLPDAERWALYDAIIDYAFTGEAPKGLSPLLNGYFSLLRPNIDNSVKHYTASVENGKKGGRPPKQENPAETQIKPSENPSETKPEPGKNREKEKEKEKEMEMDMDKECEDMVPPAAEPAPASKSPDKEPKKKFGRYGWIRLTTTEYSRLLDDLGQTELDRCIRYVDESAQGNGNKNRWKDWNLVIRRCNRDGWGLSSGKGNNNGRTANNIDPAYQVGIYI